MEIKIIGIDKKISQAEFSQIAKNMFGDLVKAVVDVNRGIIALGGELHADEEGVLLEQGSRQEDLWGINIYPQKNRAQWIEFDSMINLRPSQGNRSRGVENPAIRDKIGTIINSLIV